MIYFGTDGIRGIAGEDLTHEICFRCGNALSSIKKNCKIVIGRDTRTSGGFVLSSFVSGATMGGADVVDVGIVPTPAVSVLTRKLKADFGVMISASHNPPEYNGIKIFDENGKKISLEQEIQIEKSFAKQKIAKSNKFGKYLFKPKLIKLYKKFLIDSIGVRLDGIKVAIDCSNGANYLIAGKVFKKLGAQVVKINCSNKGEKINCDCGALYPQKLASVVKKIKADIGFAFDGDADRIVVVDAGGNIVDGDQIILFLTEMYQKFGLLKTGAVVGTSQTNMAVEKQLESVGLKLIRADVGDKFVTEEMSKRNLQIGGEQSGHVILMDYEPTGDGLLCALVISKFLPKLDGKFGDYVFKNLMKQHTKNIVVVNKYQIINSSATKIAISECENLLQGKGRVVVRASGTEPKIRIMVESEDEKLANIVLKKMENVIDSFN